MKWALEINYSLYYMLDVNESYYLKRKKKLKKITNNCIYFSK